MIDLLFGALMLFAFQMGNPNSKSVVPNVIELPADKTRDPGKKKDIFPLFPLELPGGGWVYRTQEGLQLTADEVAEKAKTGKLVPVLMLSENIPVQQYVNAETPLRLLGLRVGLSVTPDKGKTK